MKEVGEKTNSERLAAGLTSGVERLGLIEAGYRNVGRFSWDRTADELVALYHRVLES